MLALILAVLSVSVAVGMRTALPLLVISLSYTQKQELWSQVPILNNVDPRVILAVSISWSILELIFSKRLLGQRSLQIIQLLFSPIVGALVAIAVTHLAQADFTPIWLIGVIGAVVALVVTLVKVGWFFRLRGIPIWLTIVEDVLCVCLIFFAFNAPKEGGIIALLLIWLALRSSNTWREWYLKGQQQREISN
ncbi:MAG: DUF4126 domain-containing protein [Xenococcus sp. MO_188.B8]|nr:DUF4126 domain-containing protein [Xenococcus sp. MO_188.B8]